MANHYQPNAWLILAATVTAFTVQWVLFELFLHIDKCLQFVHQHNEDIEAICDLLHKRNISASVGEQILAYLAGLSAGSRMQQITGEGGDISEMLAFAWALAASGELEES